MSRVISATQTIPLINNETFKFLFSGEYLVRLPKFVSTLWLIQGNRHSTMPGLLFGKPNDFCTKIANSMIDNGILYASFQRGNDIKDAGASHMVKIMLKYFE